MIRKFIFLFVISLFCFKLAKTQTLPSKTDSLVNQKYQIIVEYQLLRSTHSSMFKGFSLTFSKRLSSNNSLGLGLEHASAPFHGDNGYHLYQLNIVPVFIDYKYRLNQKRLSPFLLADVGYSFVSYERELIGFPSSREKVKEGGVYLQGDFGFSYKLNNHIEPLFSIGFKGFHNSFNNLDVNPHGLTFRTGLMINL